MSFLDLFRTKRVTQTPPPSSQKNAQKTFPMSDEDFFMEVEDVFEIPGRGGVAVGKIQTGNIKKGTPVIAKGTTGEIQVMVAGLEMFKKKQSMASAGDSIGLLLKGYSGSLKDFGIHSIESLGRKTEKDIF